MRAALILLGLACPAAAQDAEEWDLAAEVLSRLQATSIAENVEYCGVIGFDADGHLTTSPIFRGDESSCLVRADGDVVVATASFHTHGAYSPDYFNEVPSIEDVEGDEAEGIDGYVATPGGRLWYVDTEDLVISQLCGVGCLPADPAFVPGADGNIASSYSYDELVDVLEDEAIRP